MGVAELPKLSVRLSGAVDPRRCVDIANIAEANGFHSLWFAENAFNRGVLPAASACAAATRRIGIGIGVFNPYNRHPTLMAMEIGALDELAQGRARLAIGSGIAAATERLGVSTDRPLAAVRDAITIVRAMLKGEEVNYAGGVFSAHKVKLEYRALRPDMPLLMAARGEQALALCGKIADGLMISNMCPAEFTQAAVRAVHASARQARRPAPAEVVQYIPCAVRLDRAEAYGLAKAAIGEMLPSFWALGQRVPSAKAALLQAAGLSEADLRPSAACTLASTRRRRWMSASCKPSPSPVPPRTRSPRLAVTARPARASSCSPSPAGGRKRTCNIWPTLRVAAAETTAKLEASAIFRKIPSGRGWAGLTTRNKSWRCQPDRGFDQRTFESSR